jgi:hypothetical protein
MQSEKYTLVLWRPLRGGRGTRWLMAPKRQKLLVHSLSKTPPQIRSLASSERVLKLARSDMLHLRQFDQGAL